MASHPYIVSWTFVLPPRVCMKLSRLRLFQKHAAIQNAADRLEGAVSGGNKTELSKQVEGTVKDLRNKRIGVPAAQEKLSKLREVVQAQKNELAEDELDQVVEAISKLSENSNLLGGANTAEIGSELEKLSDQMDGLTETDRTELDALLRRLAERLGDNRAAKHLVDQLNEIGTEGVSPEMLAKIARSLLEIDQASTKRHSPSWKRFWRRLRRAEKISDWRVSKWRVKQEG